jgi:ethanolamine ammonia-lyase large subunit
LYLRSLFDQRAPEFEAWLERMELTDARGHLRELPAQHGLLLGLKGMTRSA